jgi:hypothetical protein
MNRKSVDTGLCTMHGKFKDTVTTLHRSNVTCIQVLLDLIAILVILKLQGGTVMAFEAVLVNVLD